MCITPLLGDIDGSIVEQMSTSLSALLGATRAAQASTLSHLQLMICCAVIAANKRLRARH